VSGIYMVVSKTAKNISTRYLFLDVNLLRVLDND
jgi:hypothetical protein